MRAFYLSMASSPRSRKAFMLALAIAVLLLSYTSFALKGAASMFYPSREIIRRADFSRSYLEFHLSDEDFAGLYF